jgi:hypothetical protein
MKKQLLIDCIPFEVSPTLINEIKANDNATVIIKGILQRANALNQNGRVYPKRVLEKEIERYINESVKHRSAVGELDHPEKSVIEYKNVSHVITEIHWEGDNVVGTVEVLTTPAGNILRELIKNKIKIGISSRALGSVSESRDGTKTVGDDLSLLCWDIVSTPSTHGAWMTPTNLNEGILDVGQSNGITDRYNKIDSLVRDLIIEVGGK